MKQTTTLPESKSPDRARQIGRLFRWKTCLTPKKIWDTQRACKCSLAPFSIHHLRTQARNFLATAKDPTKRSHAAVANLKNIVEEGRQKLLTSLKEKAISVYARCVFTGLMTPTYLSDSTKRDHVFKDTLLNVMLDAQRDQTHMDEGVVKWSSTSKPTASASHQSAKSNTASSRELLGHYERASQHIASGKEFPVIETGWEKDIQTLQRILERQGAKVKDEVHELLNEDRHPSKEQVKGDGAHLDTDLWNRFAAGGSKAQDVKNGGTWATVAKNAQQGVRHTVKNLPEDGE